MKYSIEGGTLPVVICTLEAGESMITERGSMCWMSPNMKMETTSNGGVGTIAFASSVPGCVRAFDIAPGRELVVQKSGFLASEPTVELSVFFQRKLGAGFFGGEGFVMQRISGRGTAFLEIDGHVVEYYLQAGQSIIVDTGYLAAMEASCSMDIQSVPGVKNALFGGEGLFNTVVTGPGRIYLQTMPISQVAGQIGPFISTGS